MVGEAARKLERRLRRGVVGDQRLVAAPADLDAAKQIGLRPREPVQPRRAELRRRPENIGIRQESERRAAPVRRRPQLFEL
jgi:hypothetical protein